MAEAAKGLGFADIAAHLGMTAAELAERNAKQLERIAATMAARNLRDKSGNGAKAYAHQAEILRARHLK